MDEINFRLQNVPAHRRRMIIQALQAAAAMGVSTYGRYQNTKEWADWLNKKLEPLIKEGPRYEKYYDKTQRRRIDQNGQSLPYKKSFKNKIGLKNNKSKSVVKKARKNISTKYNKMAYKKTYKKTAKKGRRSYKRTAKNAVDKRQDKRITALYKSLKSDQATHVNRLRYASLVTTNVDQVSNTVVMKMRTSELETAMANLRYYNPAVPGTLTTADASTGTYNRQIHFQNVYQSITFRNNYQVPCKLRVWLCVPKADTSISPDSFYSSGVTDQTVGPIAVTSPLLYPTDIDDVVNNWQFIQKKNMLLQPGSQTTVIHSCKPFDYDPSNVDHHNLTFQKKYGNHCWMVRVEGCIAHDTTLGQYTTTQAGVDYFCDRKYTITYDAGVNLKDFSEQRLESSSFTNGGVVSNKPVSDNQSYSVA